MNKINTELSKKAINIKGKKYVLVSDRVLAFNELYPNGAIITKLISYEDGKAITQTKVIPDVANPTRYFTGLSQADETQGMVNKMAALENAETSSCGRAMAMLGIGVLDSIASADEMAKAGVYSAPQSASTVHCEEHNLDVPVLKSKGGNWYARCNGGDGHFVKMEDVDSDHRDIDRGDTPIRQEEIF